jgi:phenylacetate-CoA ligase
VVRARSGATRARACSVIRLYRHLFGAAWSGWQLARGRPESAYRRALEDSQYYDRAALDAVQWRALQQLLAHAYEYVPFYRRRFDVAGLRPEDIRSLEDFRRLPELTKADIRGHMPDLISTRPERGVERRTTSGSTGVPLEFYLDERYRTFGEAARARAQSWYGFARGDKSAHLAGSERDLPQWNWRQRTLATVERQRWFNLFDMTEDRMRAFAQGLEQWKPDFLFGYPSGLHALARSTRRNGLRIRPRAVQSHAEQLWGFQRAEIEEAFGCPLINTYGARESSPIATECLAHDGLHVAADVRLVELVDDQGNPTGPGAVGRVVLTDFTNYAMPLIRYANEDLASWKEDAPCPCGRTLPRLAAIHGRSSDVVRTKRGMRVHGYFFMFLFYGARGVEQFQVRQTSLDALEILIKPSVDFHPEFIDHLRERIDTHTGSAFRITCRLVEEIPTTAGKYRFTISDVPPE